MARKYQRISADCHLDMLWLPPDLFTSNASSKLRDLMPYVAENADGVKRRRRPGSPPRREEGHEGRRAQLLMAHDPNVAPDVGSALGGGQRDAAATAFPHLPGDRPRAAQAA